MHLRLPSPKWRRLATIAALIVELYVPATRAQTLTWGATGGGGTGTWNTTTPNWFNGLAAVPWTQGDGAVFGGTAGTATLGVPITVQNLTFGTSGYSITGNTLTLGVNGRPAVSLGVGNSATISSIVAGSNGLLVTGGGTVTLINGANSWTGGTTISQGSLGFDASGALGSGAVTLGDANTGSNSVALEATFGNFFGSPIPNNIVVSAFGTGTVFIGTTSFNPGSNGTNYSGIITLSRDVILLGGSTDRTSFLGQITGTGNVTILGSRITLDNSTNNFVGNVTINSGSILQTNAPNVIPRTATVNILGNGVLQFNNTGAQTFNGLNGTSSAILRVIAGGPPSLTIGAANGSGNFAGLIQNVISSFTKAGTGTQVLSGANTYTGVTTISGGILSTPLLANGGAPSGIGASANAATNLVLDGGTLQYTGTGASTGRLFTLTTNGGGIDASGSGPLTFSNTGSVALSGTGTRSLTLTGSNAGPNTFAPVLGDNGGPTSLVKTGAGNWVPTGANTYTGSTLIDAGTLAIGSGGSIAASSAVELFSGAFDTSGGGNQTIGALSGNPGTAVSLGGNTLTFGTAANATFGGVIADGGVFGGTGGSIIKEGTGTETLAGVNTYTGGTFLDAGTLAVGNNSALSTGTLAMANGTTLSFTNSNFTVGNNVTITGTGNITPPAGTTQTLTGVISDGSSPGTLAMQGPGTLALTGTSTYSGGTTIGAGTLQLGNGGASGSILGNVTDIGTLAFDRTDTVTFPGTISGTGSVNQIGTGTTILTANDTYTGGTTIGAGTLQLGNGGASGSITGNVADNGTLAFDRTDTVTFPGTISGTGSLSQIGTGTTILTANDTYTGGTTIGAGTLQLGNGGTSGSITGNVTDNGAFAFDRADTVTFPGTISGTGGVAQIGAGTTILTANDTYAGGTTIGAGTLQLGNGGASGSITGNVTDNGTLAFDRTDTVTFPGTISGTGSLSQIGTGTTILTANDSYSGGTTIGAGTVRLGNGSTSGSITGNVTDNGTLAFDRADTVTFPGTISGTGSVNQIGTGTTILTANDTYAGGTAIGAGTLQLGNGGASGSITGNVADNGTLALDRADPVTFPGTISGTGSLSQIGTGTTILTANDTYTGGTTIGAGTLQLGNGGTSGSITGNVTDNGTVAFDRADTVTFPGTISGTGGVAQIGAGTTILDANNPYSGPTSITAGTLVVGDASHMSAALSGGGPVTVASGATLGGFGSVAGSVTNNGTIAVGNALAAFAGAPDTTFTIGGNLTNTGTLLLGGATPGNVLAVHGNYAGNNGTLVLSTLLNAGGPLSNQVTDRLLVSGDPIGNTTVVVRPVGTGAFTASGIPTAANGISIVQVAGASTAGAFGLAGGTVSLAGSPYLYHLYAYGPASPNGSADPAQSLVGNPSGFSDYRLQNVYVSPSGIVAPVPLPPPGQPAPPVPPDARPKLAPQVPAYIAAPTTLFYANLQNIDELHRRLGEIRDDAQLGREDNVEVFLRGFGNIFNYKTNVPFAANGFNINGDYAAQQLGANWIGLRNAGGTMRIGLFVTSGQLWYQPVAMDGSSKGYVDSTTVAGTFTWQAAAGWYVDTIVSGGAFNGDVSTAATSNAGSLKGTSASVSVEAGYPLKLGWHGLLVEPQMQFVYQHLGFTRETDANGINLDLGGQDQGIFRAGFRVVRPFADPSGRPLTPYLIFNLLQGIGGSGTIHLSNVAFSTGAFGTELQAGGGITGALTRNLFVYSDVAYEGAVGSSGFRGWAFNGGLRYDFGAP